MLSIDMNFLRSNLTKKLAIGVSIVDNTGKTINSKLATVVLFMEPLQLLLPIANFTTYVYGYNKTANFVNLSANARSYSWDFGDGSPVVSSEISPGHIYATAGTYAVKLTATGITGAADASLKTVNIVIP
ncbi:MAG: PKD domain-containing protein [Chitinophagaceae bacterium]|nr:PKD domain-containing protein [Chitinophagaceae bacterium]